MPVGVDGACRWPDDLDELAVGVASIAPCLGLAVRLFGKKLCPSGFGVGVERCGVGDAHV